MIAVEKYQFISVMFYLVWSLFSRYSNMTNTAVDTGNKSGEKMQQKSSVIFSFKNQLITVDINNYVEGAKCPLQNTFHDIHHKYLNKLNSMIMPVHRHDITLCGFHGLLVPAHFISRINTKLQLTRAVAKTTWNSLSFVSHSTGASTKPTLGQWPQLNSRWSKYTARFH